VRPRCPDERLAHDDVERVLRIMAWRPAPGRRCGRGVRRRNYCASPSLRSCASDQERESSWLCQHVSLTQAQQQHNDDDDPTSGNPVVSLATTATSCSRWNSPSPVIPTPPIACWMITTLTRSCSRTSSPSHLQPGGLGAR
jgi:hypothetical protein